MAHLNSSYDSFTTFLTPADGAAWSLDGTWTVDLNALNSSGVSGSAVIGMSTEGDGSPVLNVSVAAEGLTPGQGHAQHIHGLLDDAGNPIDSTAPTIADDADRDGIVEVLEGVGSYGDILLSLVNGRGNFPFADQNGQVAFIANYDLTEASNFVSPVTGNQYDMDDLMPLFLREVVLHGIDVPDRIGDGTDGEVDGGENGYIGLVPAAAGEIEVASVERALAELADQRLIASDRIEAGNGDGEVFAGLGDDTILGSDGDDRIFGGADNDEVFGLGGNDVAGGGSGNDLVGGGAGNDTVFGGDGDDTVFGADGADEVSGGLGNDRVYGGAGNDSIYGAAGDDAVVGGAGDDILYAGQGSDTVNGGTGDDVLYAGADDDAGNAADDGASGALTLADYDNGYAGGAGNDIIYGGDGDDIITGDDDSRVSSAAGETFDAGADGSDVIYGGAGNDEIHTGSWADSDDGFDNSQTGMASDEAYGGDGDDILRGAGGDDVLGGGSGNDDIGGGGGDDSLYGASGDDVLMGNGGDDFVFGGTGSDAFGHSGDASDGLDTVADYSIDEGDILEISGSGTQDDFTFAMIEDDLSVSLEGVQLFSLSAYDGAGVSVSTADGDFTYM